MMIKIRHDEHAFSLDIARRLRNYFRSVYIDCIWIRLETENVINQECGNKYIFSNYLNANPQKLVVNAKLKGNYDLILFNSANSEIYIPEITIGEHGSFDAIVRNQWQTYNGFECGYYSLVSYIEILTIQNNSEAVRDLDSYVSGDYKTHGTEWKVQKLDKNIILRINGVNGSDEQINKLKDYFGYIFVDDRKALGNQRREAIVNIKLNDDKI